MGHSQVENQRSGNILYPASFCQTLFAPEDAEISGREGPCPARISFVVAPRGEGVKFFQCDGV